MGPYVENDLDLAFALERGEIREAMTHKDMLGNFLIDRISPKSKSGTVRRPDYEGDAISSRYEPSELHQPARTKPDEATQSPLWRKSAVNPTTDVGER